MKNNYTFSTPPLLRWYALFLIVMMSTWLPVAAQTTHNVCTSCGYTTIQAAINAASAGDVIEVAAGTYSENITVNKSLTLKGAQYGVKATGSARSGGESVIDGTGGSSSYVVTVEADNVTIDGFKVEIRLSARDGINTRTGNAVSPATTALRTNIALRNNWIYANLPSRTSQFNGIVFGEHISNVAQSFSAEISNVTIEDNYINLISSSSTATPSATGIVGARGIIFTNMFRNSGASLSYTNLVVDDNTIYSTYVTLMQAQLQTRLVGATITNNTIGNSRSGPNLPTLISGSVFSNNTIQNINPGSDYYSNLAGAYLGVVNSTVSNNTFQNIGGTACLVIAGGRSADATYFPASSNSTVSNNFITYNDQALSSLASYTSGILFESNTIAAAVNVNGWLTGRQAGTTGADASSITVSNNSIINGGFAAVTTYAVSQESAGETSLATCNWYGASTSPSSKMSGSVNFTPWLTSGTDSDPAIGFQPASGTCTGTPVTASAVATDAICGTGGSIDLTVTGGTAPYTIAWSNSASVEDLNGLSAGTYTVTVTDANGSTASASASVAYLPVQNATSGNRYATIQAAIDAATAGDVINVCAGTYSENITISKSLDLRGANYGVSGCSTRSAESIVQGVFTIETDGIVVDGFEFTGSNASIVSTSGATIRSNITIRNNYLHSTTAQIPIRHGLGNGGGIGSANWIITNNKISDIQAANATAIAAFNITGATINNNCIEHTNPTFGGRRGINADGLQTATINNNTINLGGSGTTNVDGNWMIQVSMSDRDVQNLNINGNTLSGAYFGISTLSQRNVSNVTISNNVIGPVTLGVTLNGGSVTPAILQPLQSNISIVNNSISTVTPTISGGVGAAVRLRNLHEAHANGPVGFSSILLNNNSFTITGADAAVLNNNAGYVLDATCNWYGASTSPSSKMSGSVNFTPWLTSGTDTDGSAAGFQPASGTCLGGLTVTNVNTSVMYATIQAAVNAASPGDVIEAGAATYNETVTIDKALTVRGPNHAVAGSGTRAAEAIVTGGFVMNGVSNVTISGFSVTGNNSPGSRGVLLGNTGTVAGPVTISNNIIENWTTSISLAGGATYPWVSNVTVSGNLIRNNTAGIGSTENVAGLTVSNNTFSGNAEGIGLGPGLTGLAVSGNTFTSTNSSHIADYGSGTMPSYSTLFATNTFGNAAAVSATNGNDYTSKSIYNTISAAVSNAAVGATIDVTAGTYAENISINKRLTIDGVGSGSNASSNTIITAAASGTSTIVYSAGGADASNRQILKDVRVTGASGGTGNNNSGILISGGSMGYFTFDNITATGNTGHGLVSNVAPATSALSDVIITGSTFSSNGSAGVRTASHSVDGFAVSNSSFTNNTGLGIAFNSSDNTTAQIGGVSLNNVTFSGNNSVADVYAFRMLGNMSLTNVDFQGSNGAGLFGLYLLGGYVNQASAPAIGTVTLNDVTFTGTYTSAGLSFLGYSNLAGVSMTDVVLSISNPTANRAHLRLSGVAGTLDLGNTAFITPGSVPPALDILLNSNFGSSGSIATVQVDATNATFDGVLGSAMTLSQLFAREDRIRHSIDGATDATGFVRVKAGEVFVTTNSFASPATAASIQRGIDAAASGDILNINDGTYIAQAITVNKQLDIRGQGNSTIVQNSGGNAFTYTAAGSGSSASNRAYLRNLKISGSTNGVRVDQVVNYITLDGVSIEGNTSYGIHLNNTSGVMQDWVVQNSTFHANSSDGFRMGMAANVNGLVITGCTFTNQGATGIYIPQQSSSPGGCTNVTISNNTLSNNGPVNNLAAMYIEKLSNATISGNTMTNNGLSTNPRAIIVNLKYGTYSNITISGNTSLENRGATQTNGYGINIQGRNDASSYNSNPGTLSTVSVTGNSVTGFYRGIEVDNAVDWNTTTVSNNTISGCNLGILGVIYGVGNTANTGTTMEVHDNSITGSTTAITNFNPNGGTIDATCNWYGTTNANTIASLISGTVTYSPWLTSGTDTDLSATGFQPSGSTCGGTAPAIASSVTNVSCFGLANGAIDITVSGGSTPYSFAWSNAETSEDLTGLAVGVYTVTVTDANGSTVSSSISVSQPDAPTTAGTIVGTNQACLPGVAGQQEFTTSLASTNATTYTWTWSGSSGVTISNNGSRTVTLNYTNAAIQAGITGTLTVVPSDICGNNAASSSTAIQYQIATPVTPGSISGNSQLCPGDVITCSVADVQRATSYTWTAPANTSITSGAGTNVIQLTVSAGYTGGTLSVTASNVCGTSPERTKSLVTNVPSTPSAISGTTSGVCGSAVSYTVPAVTGATTYTWSVSAGGTISAGQGTTGISVNWTSTGASSTLSVVSGNACGSSSARTLTVAKSPARPNAITGVKTPACTTSVDTASIATVAGASSYIWAITGGGAFTPASPNTKDARLTWGAAAATSQSITVRASNGCGTSTSRALTGLTVVTTCSSRMADATAENIGLVVYPNPASERATCSFNSSVEQPYSLRMNDMSGRTVVSRNAIADAGVNTAELSFGEVSTGIYFVELILGDSRSVYKLVVE